MQSRRRDTASWTRWDDPATFWSYWNLSSPEHDNLVRFRLNDRVMRETNGDAIGDHMDQATRAFLLIQHEDC